MIPCSNEGTKGKIGARANKGLICMLSSLYSMRASIIKPRFRGRKRFNSVRNICLHPSKYSFSDTLCGMICITRTKTTVPPRVVSQEIRKLRKLGPVKVPKTARSGWKWRRWCKRCGNSNKTMIRGAKRGRDRVGVKITIRGKEKIKRVRCMVMTVWNTCRLLNELVQSMKNRKFEGLLTSTVSKG